MKWKLTIACMAFIAATSAAMAESEQPAAVVEEVDFIQRLDNQVPLDLTFRNEEGRIVQLSEYFGENPVVLSLVYYECPMLCTLTMNGMLASFHELSFDVGDEFDVVTVSFDHEETHVLAAAKKENYLNEYGREGSEEGWHFLVGEQKSVETLCQAVGFGYKYDEDTDEYAHRSGILVITPEGRISHYFAGVEFSARDLRLALVEASEGKIGSAVDKLFLLCYHYDPTVGKYGLVITNVINLACGITVAALGLFLFVMLKREREANRSAQSGRAHAAS